MSTCHGSDVLISSSLNARSSRTSLLRSHSHPHKNHHPRNRRPPYLYAERLAASLNEPLDQLLHRALIEKLDEIGTAHTQERAKRGSREAFLRALRKAPDVPPNIGDELA